MDEVTWKIQPHTDAKHRILREYLKAWFPILARTRPKRLLYVDAFAGPGIYEGGEDGSPIVAIKTALEQPAFTIPVQFRFIEQHEATHDRLVGRVRTIRDEVVALGRRDLVIPDPIRGDAIDVLRSVTGKRAEPLGPALFFLDQFGYSDIPIDVIGAILAHPKCEVLTYLYINGILRFLDDATKHRAITVAYGDESWRGVFEIPSHRRYTWLADLYREKLSAHAEFVWDFTMCDAGGQPRYSLFFCTNHDRGLEVMKDAMLRVDDSGEFRFSDAADPTQMLMLGRADDAWMQDHLWRFFSGRTVLLRDIRRHVLTRTPVTKYRKLLATLRSEGILDLPNAKRGRQAFDDDDILVRFSPYQTRLASG